MTPAQLAQRRQAGLALVQKYGRFYMRRIGVRGGRPRIQESIKRHQDSVGPGAETRGKGQSNPGLQLAVSNQGENRPGDNEGGPKNCQAGISRGAFHLFDPPA